MINKENMPIADRISFIAGRIDSINKLSNKTFSDQIYLRSLESHFSELMAIKSKSDLSKPVIDVIDLRIKGLIVDMGSIPLDLLSSFAQGISGTIQKATGKLLSGKDSPRISNDVKDNLDMRLAGLSHGSTRLTITLSTGLSELFETVPSRAIHNVFDVFDADDDNKLFEFINEIGFNSTKSIKEIIDVCEKNNLSFDFKWVGQFSNGVKETSVSPDKIKKLYSRLSSTSISDERYEIINGIIDILSVYEKIEIDAGGDKIKITYPESMFNEIQSKCTIGKPISVKVKATDIINSDLSFKKTNYELIEII